MGTFRRWAGTLIASFDGIIQNIQNHEAMVTSAITEAEATGARARAQLQRVRKDGQNMRRTLIELREQQELWRDRAKNQAAEDEKKALECLRRAKRAAEQIGELEKRERDHARLEKDLTRDLEAIDERLAALRQQRNVMRTRQSRAEALRLVQQIDSTTVNEIDDIFGRWEAQVAACEARAGASEIEIDELDEELTSVEEERALREQLAALRTETDVK